MSQRNYKPQFNYFLEKDIKIPLIFDFLFIISFFDELQEK